MRSDPFHSFLRTNARSWARRFGTRDQAAARIGLAKFLGRCATLYGREIGLALTQESVAFKIEATARYWAKAGHGRFLARRKGMRGLVPLYGQGMHPRGPERPNATKVVRQPRIEAARQAQESLVREGIEPAGRHGRHSASQIIAACAGRQPELGPIGVSTVSTMRRQGGEQSPHRSRGLAGLRPVEREFLYEIEALVPYNSIRVLDLDSACRMFWPRSDRESTRRSHRSRIRSILDRIANANVGVSLGVAGGYLVIGRHRSIPDDLRAAVASARFVRTFPDRLLRARDGAFSATSQVGRDVTVLAEYADYRLNFLVEEAESLGVDESLEAVEALAPAFVETMTPDRALRYFEESRDDLDISRLLGVRPRYAAWEAERFTPAYVEAFTQLHGLLAAGADLVEQLRWVRARQGQPLTRGDRRFIELYGLNRHMPLHAMVRIGDRRPGRPQRRSAPAPWGRTRRVVSGRETIAHLSPIRPRRVVAQAKILQVLPTFSGFAA